MARKKSDLEERVRNLRFEDSQEKRETTIKEALSSGDVLLEALAHYHLGVNEKDYSVAMEHLGEAYKLWKDEKHDYWISADRAMERLRDAKKQRDRPLWKKLLLPFRSAA
jgi:hypothetical protein